MKILLLTHMKRKNYNDLKHLQKLLGYTFKNSSVLDLALTHSSYKNELKASFPHKTVFEDNERLEFLGDTILSFLISRKLYSQYRNFTEGDLSKFRSILVSKEYLFKVAKHLTLVRFLRLGKGESAGTLHKKSNILANAVEAVIAAIYLDGGMKAAEQFILRCFHKYLSVKKLSHLDKNYKSALQEYSQKHFRMLPHYHTIEKKGKFHATVSVAKRKKATGEGHNKREAEQAAAKILIKKLKNK